MIGKIIEIKDNIVHIKLVIDIAKQPNLVNLYIVFDEGTSRVVIGQVINTNREMMEASVVGEINEGVFTSGASSKPAFKSDVRMIKMDELTAILGSQELQDGYANFGSSTIYSGYKLNVPINDFFNANFSVIGNSGSGKSSTVASILQKIFRREKPPIGSNIFFFDAFGEYNHAFGGLHDENPLINYKCYTTNPEKADGNELLQIPVWLLDVDDLALLLDVNDASQLPIIEKTLEFVPILTGTSPNVIKRKNDIIARALQDILLSGAESTKIHDQVTAVLTKFNTESLNLNTPIVQPGYTRPLKQCLFVDKTGKVQEMELVVEFIRGYILEDEIEIKEEEKNKYYSLHDLELALEFALINEGILSSEKVFDYANILSVRLHTLANGENSIYFSYPKYVTQDEWIESLLINNQGAKCQIVNFSINYVDDRLAKAITKIISRKIFNKAAILKPRGSRAFHIVIEEAHRYVQNDNDVNLLGYNIFERISKEGRKYGVFLGLITQRPSELSDTCISQCNNFIILRVLHPKDLHYIKEMIPNITNEIVLQLKDLKPGHCISFGMAFRVPMSISIDLPNPRPLSDNVDINTVWYNEYVAGPAAPTVGGPMLVGTPDVSAPPVEAAPVPQTPQDDGVSQVAEPSIDNAVINRIIDVNNNPEVEAVPFIDASQNG